MKEVSGIGLRPIPDCLFNQKQAVLCQLPFLECGVNPILTFVISDILQKNIPDSDLLVKPEQWNFMIFVEG